MKKQIPLPLALLLILCLLGGVGGFYYMYMKRPVKYTIMPEPMVSGGFGSPGKGKSKGKGKAGSPSSEESGESPGSDTK